MVVPMLDPKIVERIRLLGDADQRLLVPRRNWRRSRLDAKFAAARAEHGVRFDQEVARPVTLIRSDCGGEHVHSMVHAAEQDSHVLERILRGFELAPRC